MTVLRPYRAADLVALASYRLGEHQSGFSSSPYEAIVLMQKLRPANRQGVTVWHEDQAVGFFILDAGPERVEFSRNPQALLLRSFSINPSHQGQGIGRQVMAQLPDYCRQYHPGCHEIVLGVNQHNQPAYDLYLSQGFVDLGRMRIGPSGPQHMLALGW